MVGGTGIAQDLLRGADFIGFQLYDRDNPFLGLARLVSRLSVFGGPLKLVAIGENALAGEVGDDGTW